MVTHDSSMAIDESNASEKSIAKNTKHQTPAPGSPERPSGYAMNARASPESTTSLTRSPSRCALWPSIEKIATPAKSDVKEFSSAIQIASETTSWSGWLYDPNATSCPVPTPRE